MNALSGAVPRLLHHACQQHLARLALPALQLTSTVLKRFVTSHSTDCCCQTATRADRMTALLSATLTTNPHLMTKSKHLEPRFARPMFHLAPNGPRGWVNDPNGPLLHKGNYHLFWQNVPGSAEWSWGLGWGHATSKDLVQWKQLPVALEPTPNSLDQDGCFSGCATVDVNGAPSILYTGVVRQPHPTPTLESQLVAVAADPDDPELRDWVKLPGSFLPKPPASMDLTGWRDPFVLQRPSSNSSEGNDGHNPWWYVMVGAGVRDKCGTALVYRSKNLTEGWEYVGPLCESTSSHMWECPIMGTLTNTPPHITATSNGYSMGSGNCHPAPSSTNGHSNDHNSNNSSTIQRHMLCVSPDYCVNIPVYWLGDYKSGRFDLEKADGPHPLDLGDILYAPNILTDKHGRTVLWAWMQEKSPLRPVGIYDASCCLCVPRVLYLSRDGKALLQEPLPELALLRKPHSAWHIGSTAAGCGGAGPVKLLPGIPMQVGGSCATSHVDMEVTIAKGGADSVVLVLQPFDGLPGAAGAGVAYCWQTHTLQVIHSADLATLQSVAATPVDPPTYKKLSAPSPEEEAAARAAAAASGALMRCGGRLHNSSSSSSANSNGSPDDTAAVTLRILIDGSCIEVFTSTGQALGTRVYRGDEAPVDFNPASAGAAAAAAEAVLGASYSRSNGAIELVSFGPGAAELVSASMWEMESMWMQDAMQQQKEVLEAMEGVPVAAAAAAQMLQSLVAAEAAAAAAAAAAVPLVLPVADLTLEPASPAVVPEAVSVEAL